MRVRRSRRVVSPLSGRSFGSVFPALQVAGKETPRSERPRTGSSRTQCSRLQIDISSDMLSRTERALLAHRPLRSVCLCVAPRGASGVSFNARPSRACAHVFGRQGDVEGAAMYYVCALMRRVVRGRGRGRRAGTQPQSEFASADASAARRKVFAQVLLVGSPWQAADSCEATRSSEGVVSMAVESAS